MRNHKIQIGKNSKRALITAGNSILAVGLRVIAYTFESDTIEFWLLILAICCSTIGYGFIDFQHKRELDKNHESKDVLTGDIYKNTYASFQKEFNGLSGRKYEKEYTKKFLEGNLFISANIILGIWNIIVFLIILCYWKHWI